jgi:hypothetical protein
MLGVKRQMQQSAIWDELTRRWNLFSRVRDQFVDIKREKLAFLQKEACVQSVVTAAKTFLCI